MLVFIPTTARAGRISPNFGGRRIFAGGIPTHYFIGVPALADQIGHDFHRFVYVMIEKFIAGAEIVKARFAIRRFNESIAGTVAIAGKEHIAIAAVLRK
jgi:hypothetical protein